MKLSLLYNILLYCICLEEILAYMNIPVTSIKYIVTIILTVRLYKKGAHSCKLPNILGLRLFIALLLIALIRGIPSYITGDIDGFLYWKNLLWFPVLMYIYTNMEKFSDIKWNDYISHYINAMCVYVFLNFLLYYISIPFLITERQRYWGRLTVGYPTIDVILLCLALGFILIIQNHWSVKQKVIKFLIISIGTAAQASGTGLVLFFILLIIALAYNLRIGVRKNTGLKIFRRTILASLFIICIGTGSLISYFKSQNPLLYENMRLQIENRFNILIGKGDNSELEINTLEVREMHLKHAEKRFIHTDFLKAIGIGYGRISMTNYDNSHIVCEDQYTLNKITIGWIGNYVYILVLISLFFKILKLYNRNDNVYFFIITWSFLAIASFTSGCLMSFGPIALWSMMYAYFKNEQTKLGII